MSGQCVTFFPDYRRSNPYQRLLYEALPTGWYAVPGGLDVAFANLKAGTGRVFHLHWTAALFQGCDTEDTFNAAADRFLEGLDHYRAHGGRVIWTVHNLLPHDMTFREAEIAFRTALVHAVDVIHIHDHAALAQVNAVFPLPERKCVIAPHGHMIDAFASPLLKRLLSPPPTRRKLGLSASAKVAAVIGQLRPNKGIEDFILAVEKTSGIEGFVAGRVTAPAKPGSFRAHCERRGVACREGFIPVHHMPPLFDLADVIILPYRKILTSGSLVLACSMAKPVVVPALPSFEALKGLSFVDFYTPGDPDSLAAAFKGLAAREDLKAQGQAAKAHIARYPWDQTADILFG